MTYTVVPVARGEVPRARSSLPHAVLCFWMRPLLNGGTLGRRVDALCSKLSFRWNYLNARDPETRGRAKLPRR